MDTIKITFALTEELASKLDHILNEAQANNGFAHIYPQSEYEKNEYIAIIDLLENLRLGKEITDDEFQISASGIRCILTGGFTAMYKEKIEQRKREELSSQLTRHQLKAAKREPYLIIWSVITTFSTLVLGWLQFFK